MFLILTAKAGKKKLFYNGLLGEFQEVPSVCCLYDYCPKHEDILKTVLRKYKTINPKVTFKLLKLDIFEILEELA